MGDLLCTDNAKARLLGPDGSYSPIPRPEAAPVLDAQAAMMAEAVTQAQEAAAHPPVSQERHRGLLERLLARLK